MLSREDFILPSHLRDALHLTAFEQIWHDRVESIDTSALMMYLIDAVSPKAFSYLADQFGIITLRSWKLATTDAERRELIKNAIKTRSAVGTVAAVKAAIASLGFDPTHLVERAGSDPLHGWAQFKMAFSSSELSILDAALHELLMQLIVDSKPARCEYLGLEYDLAPIIDMVEEEDEVTIGVGIGPVDSVLLPGFKYDGAHKYDGSEKYRPGCEVIAFTVF